MENPQPETIDEYIAGYPPEKQIVLRDVCKAIRQAAPEAGEKISWGMATFTLHGNLVHFAGEKKHVGFHPTPSAVEAFRDELESVYKYSKGTVQFPYSEPLPLDLIQRMVRFRVEEQKSLWKAKQ